MTHPQDVVTYAFKTNQESTSNFWKIFLYYLNRAGVVSNDKFVEIRMSALPKYVVSYSISLFHNRTAVECVIEALSQMGPQEIREAKEMMKGGAGRGFYYAYDPVLRPPPPSH